MLWCTLSVQRFYISVLQSVIKETATQGVTKRCLLSWVTNNGLAYEPKYGGRVVAGSQQMSSAVHMELKHRLNMEFDLQSLFGLLCTAVLIG
jgi:hypothetical protein